MKHEYGAVCKKSRYRVVDSNRALAARQQLTRLLNGSQLTERDIHLLLNLAEHLTRR
jgi:hypothetical protein